VADSDLDNNGIADCLDTPAPEATPNNRDGLRTFLSLFFGTPICAPGVVGFIPLTIVGIVGWKLTIRRRNRR
jgi:hypothetical protein